jgi:hypothetical protein
MIKIRMQFLGRKTRSCNLEFLISSFRKNLLFIFFAFLFFSPFLLYAQLTDYKQFTPEFQLNRAINDKWAAEFDINNTFSNTSSEEKVFKTVIQGSGHIWGHYFFSPRWKFSSSLAYYYNHDSPEIGQYESKEWRLALQGIYYIHKIGYTLSTRMRAEVRYMTNEEGVFEDTYRYRQMLKFIKPINSQVLRQGVFYAVASEELLFRSTYKSTGFHYFDRNIFVVGGGYMINDDLQVELTYTNELIPRDNGGILNNVISITFTTNNLFSNIKHKVGKLFTSPPPNVDENE